MKLSTIAAVLVLITTEAQARSQKPVVIQEPAPAPVITPAPIPVTPPGRDFFYNLADTSPCAKSVYGGGQGKAPQGYRRGVVLSYAKAICNPDSDVYKIGSQPLGSPSKDALAHYGIDGSTQAKRLNSLFAIMMGSAAHESSWRWCVGRDTVAKESDKKICLYGDGSTCEAGLHQTSYNSVPKTGPLRDLYNAFKSYPSGCFSKEYKGSTTCSSENMKAYGSSQEARAYQTLSKECPGFAVESAVIMMRTVRTHYGPINKKKAEMFPACVSMFDKVRQAVQENPDLCKAL